MSFTHNNVSMVTCCSKKMKYQDLIHGFKSIPFPLSYIIESPHFQRLKKIKQLGLIDKIMPAANTTRYEHCIGTYILADKMLKSLERDDLQIPEFYKNVVGIAALLHDVGHGPLSHTWEIICGDQYHHESNSFGCIDEIFKDDRLIKWAGDDRAYIIELIKALIVGDSSGLRDGQFRFIFEIVNNKQCDIDVDKWDYLKRDYLYAKEYPQCLPVNVDFDDVFMNARVSSDRAHIEYRFCDFHKIYNIFDARQTFHMCFYESPFHVCMGNILKYIISTSANDFEQIDDGKEKWGVLSIRSEHVNAYLKFHDDEIWRILKNLKSKNMKRLVNCLSNASIAEDTVPNNEYPYLKADTCVAYAGEVMKSEKMFFYGDEKDKPILLQKKGYYKSLTYFKINE